MTTRSPEPEAAEKVHTLRAELRYEHSTMSMGPTFDILIPARLNHRIVIFSIIADPVGSDPTDKYGLLSNITTDSILVWQGSLNISSPFGVCAADTSELVAVGSVSAQDIDITVTYMYVPETP